MYQNCPCVLASPPCNTMAVCHNNMTTIILATIARAGDRMVVNMGNGGVCCGCLILEKKKESHAPFL